ncbi:MAG TPA: ribonuclease HI family protein [Anaerolineae bacterium]|nr:ribonuclease HI family protein [Anaerolineae bacterium]
MNMRRLVIYADGAARGNPGPAGIGVVIEDERGRVLKEVSQFVGRQTNNQAEYLALIQGLEAAAEYQADAVLVRLDSELLVHQLRGEYKVKSPRLEPLMSQVQKLLARYKVVGIEHIERRYNRAADRLANRAINTALREGLA